MTTLLCLLAETETENSLPIYTNAAAMYFDLERRLMRIGVSSFVFLKTDNFED